MSSHRSAAAEGRARPDRAVADLIRLLRWRAWTPSEAAALDRRRRKAELRQRHLAAATGFYAVDRAACRYHARRMVEARA